MSGPTYPQLCTRWERVHAFEAAFKHEKAGRPSGPKVIAYLNNVRAALTSTDTEAALVIQKTIDVLAKHGFDHADAGTWKRAPPVDPETIYMRRMDQVMQRNGGKLRSAAARVAVEYWVAGKSFDAVVKRLSRAYREWEKSHPPK
jgi:hypothetical protein